MAESVGTICQQNMLLCQAYHCSVVLPIILVNFIDASSHWTKRNSDREMLTVQKHVMITFEIQTAGIHTPPNRAFNCKMFNSPFYSCVPWDVAFEWK